MGLKDYEYYLKYVRGRYTCQCSYCIGRFNYTSVYDIPGRVSLLDGEIQLFDSNGAIAKISKAACMNHHHQGTGMNCRRCRAGAFYYGK